MKPESPPAFKRLIIVSYRLPFRFVTTRDHTHAVPNSGGLVSAILSLSEGGHLPSLPEGKMPVHWVGKGDRVPPDRMEGGKGESPFTLHPVTIPAGLNEKFYGGFCNNTIWPLFHYFPWLTTFGEDHWAAYVKSNQLFAGVLASMIEPGDFIWIQDYQLLLLPGMIREKFPEATISFFLHIPFPSFEIFRLMPRKWRESLLTGILGADLVGFHTKAYARYFGLTVKKLLKFQCKGQTQVIHGDRRTRIGAYPIGIDFEKFHHECTSPRVRTEKQKIRRSIGDHKLVFSIDRLDYTKGLLHRLLAYEDFLVENRDWHRRVVFNMVVIPSRDSIAQYQKMKKEIEATVGRINGNFSDLGWRPVIYQYRSLSHTELVALYNMGDVGLITPLRDGMNLVAKEYVASQEGNEGVLILSEMAGAADELSGALIINPHDRHETSNAIRTALEMPAGLKSERIRSMQKKIRKNNVARWAAAIFRQTVKSK